MAKESKNNKHHQKGEILNNLNVSVKRPAPRKGVIPAKSLRSVIGKRARLNLKADKQLKWTEII